MAPRPQIIVAIAMLVAGITLLVAGVFVSANYGEWLLGLSVVLTIASSILLFWSSRKHRKQLLIYLLSIVASVLSLWLGTNLLDGLSYSRHGDIGPGGGWSIAIGSMFLSLLLGLALMLSASIAHLGAIASTRTPQTFIPRSHYVLCLIWLSLITLLGFYV